MLPFRPLPAAPAAASPEAHSELGPARSINGTGTNSRSSRRVVSEWFLLLIHASGRQITDRDVLYFTVVHMAALSPNLRQDCFYPLSPLCHKGIQPEIHSGPGRKGTLNANFKSSPRKVTARGGGLLCVLLLSSLKKLLLCTSGAGRRWLPDKTQA